MVWGPPDIVLDLEMAYWDGYRAVLYCTAAQDWLPVTAVQVVLAGEVALVPVLVA